MRVIAFAIMLGVRPSTTGGRAGAVGVVLPMKSRVRNYLNSTDRQTDNVTNDQLTCGCQFPQGRPPGAGVGRSAFR